MSNAEDDRDSVKRGRWWLRLRGPQSRSAEATERQRADQMELIRLEYESLRSESADARTSQQATLAWSLAAYAALIAGGLVFVSTALEKGSAWRSPLDFAVFALAFGFVIPVLGFAGAMAYLGELQRMERVGSYIRGLELSLSRDIILRGAPLRWESFLINGDQRDWHPHAKREIKRNMFDERKTYKTAKLPASYVGGILNYVVVLTASYAIFIFGFAIARYDNEQSWVVGLCIVWTAASAVTVLFACGANGLKVVRMSSRTVDYEAIRPAFFRNLSIASSDFKNLADRVDDKT